MSKNELIQRLNKTYKMERSHAFFTFPAIAIYLLFNHSLVDILFLLYGLILCIFILFQGQHYFKLKLKSLHGNSFDQNKNLLFFRKSKKSEFDLNWFNTFCFRHSVIHNQLDYKSRQLIDLGCFCKYFWYS